MQRMQNKKKGVEEDANGEKVKMFGTLGDMKRRRKGKDTNHPP
jgi:hypothetical protein